MKTRSLRIHILFTLCLLAVPGARAQDKAGPAVAGKPVLWSSVNVAEQDLAAGPGFGEMKPDLSHITFVRDETGGYSTKYRIKDGAGHTWVAKVGAEAQSETAAVRLLAALGYKTEVNYLIPNLTIPGKGDLTNVRLEARPKDVKRLGPWKWNDNPFKGTRELQALKIMMSFLNNWDMKDANNEIVESGGEQQYIISDMGVSFGTTGGAGMAGRSRNEPADYKNSGFLTDAKSGKLQFAYNGKNLGQLNNITKEDGRWLADLLLQLTDKQIEDAFRAANYSDADVALLTRSVKDRIQALDAATRGAN